MFVLLLILQCSTVVHNTVVRATIKVNGKPQILGTRSPQTPESTTNWLPLQTM